MFSIIKLYRMPQYQSRASPCPFQHGITFSSTIEMINNSAKSSFLSEINLSRKYGMLVMDFALYRIFGSALRSVDGRNILSSSLAKAVRKKL